MTENSSGTRRFAIALSFPGEHRAYVEQVAIALLSAFGGEQGKDRIFYDNWHESKVIGYAANRKLQEIYAENSDLIVPFYCLDYVRKDWCGVELRAIEELLFSQEYDRVLPFRFDMVDIPSSFKTDIFPIVSERSPGDVARLILERYNEITRIPFGTPTMVRNIPVDISRIDKYAPEELFGREAERGILKEAWEKAQRDENERPRIITYIAFGGEGKTSLIAKWATNLADQGWPGCDAAFAWSFYSQGSQDQSAASSDLFLKEALTFFGDSETAGSSQGAYEKGRRLAQLIGEKRALLILDGIEPHQYPPSSPMSGELKDHGLSQVLRQLAASSKGLCVVTTRYSITDLKAYRQTAAPERELLRLSKEAGVALLRSLGLKGTQEEFEALVEDVKGHALTLRLLGTWLYEAYGGDIRKRDQVKLEEIDNEQGSHAFRVMDAYAQWFESGDKHGKRALALLRLMGLFDRPAEVGCLKAVWKAPLIPNLTDPLAGISERHRNLAITRLEKAKLVTITRNAASELLSLDAHPLLREYFAKQLREHYASAGREAHRRIYKHLCETTDKPNPTLEDLQPFYQAVFHACRAGMQRKALDVFHERVMCGEREYSTKKLGAFGSDLGAVACFFEEPWSRISPEVMAEKDAPAMVAILMSHAGSCLRALGRLTDARVPTEAAVEMADKTGDCGFAAACAINLSELDLARGDLARAINEAEEAITYAEREQKRAQSKGFLYAAYADALHQAGRRADAEASFRKAEAEQAELCPDMPLLPALSGFRYCDLLLAADERAAWRRMIGSDSSLHFSALPPSSRAVLDRAKKTLRWAIELDSARNTVALDKLTLCRARLYNMILDDRVDDISSAQLHKSFEDVVADNHRAGQLEFFALSLLTRAWLRSCCDMHFGPNGAQEDLDEAWRIAERGPMPLLLADIHLYRARLFGLSRNRPEKYPWESPQRDLADARRLIEERDYRRRNAELDDATEAATHLS